MMKIPLIDQYTKEELEQIVSQSLSFVQVIDKLGYATHNGGNNKTIKNRIEKYGIDTSHFTISNGVVKYSDEQIFIQNSKVSQHCLRNRVIKKQLFPYVCCICGQPPLWNGKQLPLILDHKNGLNHDNRIENIRWVCPNCNQQLPTTGGRNISNLYPRIKKHYYCKECGEEVSRFSKYYCKSCYTKNHRKQIPVSRDELKGLIRDIPFTTIGKQYGVTDNAIRKWCKKYQLPFKTREIRKMSDEQWNNI